MKQLVLSLKQLNLVFLRVGLGSEYTAAIISEKYSFCTWTSFNTETSFIYPKILEDRVFTSAISWPSNIAKDNK